MNRLLAAVALCALASSASSQISPDVKSMISAYDVADQECRGSPDADAACYRRTDIGQDLNKIGWCYGKRGQGRADFEWHRCTTRSLRAHAE
ncbi:hypothetical protein ACQKQD_18690 [Methylobacterium sp. NPDC080182]|uniref:hypothetical protein n=1 Tax=Methylobacterium sp. NPDC080182 TaxID=3390590 RepID=UPI003D073024